MKFNPFSKLQEFIEKSRLSGIVIAVLSFVLIMLFSYTDFYQRFEYALYDWRFKIKSSVKEWDALAFVNVDEPSINEVGEYPWARNIYAKGLDVLREAGVRQQTFDFEFLDRTSNRINEEAFNNLGRKAEKKGKITKDDLSRIIVNNDRILAESVKKLNKVILPFHFKEDVKARADVSGEYQQELDEAMDIFLEKASVKIPEDKLGNYSAFSDPTSVDLGIPIPELVRSARGFGYTNRDPDIDGTERKIRLVRAYKGRLFFQMGLVMLMDACGVKKENVVINPGSNLILKGAVNPMTFKKEDIAVPIDELGMMYINWAGPGKLADSFQHLSFYALLEYTQIKEEINDYFDEQDKNTGKWQLSKLYEELDNKYQEFSDTTDLDKKRDIYNDVKKLRSRIREVLVSYTKPVLDEIEKIKAKLKDRKDSELSGMLDSYMNYKKGIDIVMSVESMQDKITVVGMTATGTQDLGVIPISNEYMMVGTYPNVVNTIVNGAFIIKVNKYINLAIMLSLALLLGIAVQRVSAKLSMFVILLVLIAVNLVNIGFFSFYTIWIDQFGTNLAVFLPSFIIAGIKLMREESQKRYIKGAFSRYLAPTVIEKIIENPKALELGGEEQNISIFFSDIQKFSTISERLTPPELVRLLNEYLSEMTDIILSYGGTVDKYIGDAIMAFYGAPLSYEDHARRCCRAAIAMKKRLRDLQDHWREAGRDVLKVRMGMNSGKAVVGNMGSSTQMGYTAMGDAVNLASRLEGVNKVYSTYAMISETTYQYVKEEIEVRKLDTVRVIGKEEPIVIYELLGEKGKLPDRMYGMMEKYYKALEYFEKRDWNQAINYFQQGLKIVKDDGPSIMYIDRCEKYLRRAPSKDWDGVYKLTSK